MKPYHALRFLLSSVAGGDESSVASWSQIYLYVFYGNMVTSFYTVWYMYEAKHGGWMVAR